MVIVKQVGDENFLAQRLSSGAGGAAQSVNENGTFKLEWTGYDNKRPSRCPAARLLVLYFRVFNIRLLLVGVASPKRLSCLWFLAWRADVVG